jgi:hypothetical protein
LTCGILDRADFDVAGFLEQAQGVLQIVGLQHVA